MRSLLLIAAALAAVALAACGGGDSSSDKPAPGSRENPLVALPNPNRTRTPPTAPLNEAGRDRPRAGGSADDRPTLAPKPPKPRAAAGSETASATASRPRRSSPRAQKTLPASGDRPCSLVTKAQARSIIGAAIEEPLQAPQGPTCIYRTPSGTSFVTLAVESTSVARLRAQIRNERAVTVADRTAYCGTFGKPMLYLPVGGGRVLSIAAPCGLARRFAAKAAQRL